MNAQLWTVAALLPGGVFTGAITLLAWERVWLWRRMTIDQYVVDFRRSLRLLDPTMPILLVITGIGTVGLATQSSGTKQTLLVTAIACQLAILIGSLVLAEPINFAFRRQPEGMAPPRVETLRRRWRRLHLARTAVALTAYLCIVSAATQT